MVINSAWGEEICSRSEQSTVGRGASAPPRRGGANGAPNSYGLVGNRPSNSFSMFNAFMAFSEL